MPNLNRQISPADAMHLRLVAGLYAHGVNSDAAPAASLDVAKAKIFSRCQEPEKVWQLFPDQVETEFQEIAIRFCNDNGGLLPCA